MNKRDREMKIKRIEKAIKTIDEALGDLWEALSFDQRCKLRDSKSALEFILKWHRA